MNRMGVKSIDVNPQASEARRAAEAAEAAEAMRELATRNAALVESGSGREKELLRRLELSAKLSASAQAQLDDEKARGKRLLYVDMLRCVDMIYICA